jgi:hypothetical protein
VGNLGDIMVGAGGDPMDRYFQIICGQVELPRRRWIVRPEWVPPVIPGAEALQRLIEEHQIPRNWQLFEDLFVLMQRGEFRVKSPNWIEPPITSEMLDLVNEVAIAVGATNTNILTYTVPDRHIVSLKSFGHALTVALEWDNVIWNVFINNNLVRTYAEFRMQRGTISSPTPLPRPITLKGRDVFRVTARTAGAAVSASARLPGYIIAPRTITQDGSYKDWNSR